MNTQPDSFVIALSMYASLISNVFLKNFLHTIVLVPATSKEYDYISQREKQLPEKVVKLVDCNNCKYKCTKNITEDRGEEYLNYFGRLNRM
jgi:hypothetical protein